MTKKSGLAVDQIDAEEDVASFMIRIKPAGAAYHAVLFNMSRLLPFNREPAKIERAYKEVVRVFTPIKAKIYRLINHNFVCFVEKQTIISIERAISQFKRTLPVDPILSDTLKKDVFCQVYDLGLMWRDLNEIVLEIESDPIYRIRKTDENGQIVNLIDRGIDSVTLTNLDRIITNSDLRPYLKRQSVYWYDGKEKPHKIAGHLFLSVQKIQESLAISEPITANIWLFKHLTTALDKQTLTILKDLLEAKAIESLHVNINLRTIVSSTFYRFFDQYTKQKPLSFCVDVVDYIAHPDAMKFAQELVSQKDCRLILSGLTSNHLEVLNFDKIPASLFKINWGPGICEQKELIKSLVDEFGAYKFILHQCSSEKEVQVGLDCGIEQFQGFGIEKMLEVKNIL